jgi:hypothetical protein
MYGLGITFAGAVVALFFHLLGFSTSAERFGTYLILSMLSSLVILITGITLGVRAKRAEYGVAGYTFGNAFKTGFLIVVAAALAGAVFQFLYFKLLNPDFVEVMIEWTRGWMEKVGARPADIEAAAEDMRAKSTMTRQLINGIIFNLVLGSLATLVIAAILKRRPADEPGTLPPSLT